MTGAEVLWSSLSLRLSSDSLVWSIAKCQYYHHCTHSLFARCPRLSCSHSAHTLTMTVIIEATSSKQDTSCKDMHIETYNLHAHTMSLMLLIMIIKDTKYITLKDMKGREWTNIYSSYEWTLHSAHHQCDQCLHNTIEAVHDNTHVRRRESR